jgi:hypothetical protein
MDKNGLEMCENKLIKKRTINANKTKKSEKIAIFTMQRLFFRLSFI